MKKILKQRIQDYRWYKILYRILCELLRGGICLFGGVVIVCVGVPLMELAMDNYGTRFWIEAAVCYFAILWMVAKVYGIQDEEKQDTEV